MARAKKGWIKKSYEASNVGKDYRALGGAVFDSTIGLVGRALRGVLNTANYAARTVIGVPEAIAKGAHKKVVGHLEEDLEDKLAAAEEHHRTFITLDREELEQLNYLDPRITIPHLASKIADAERRQGQTHLSKTQAYDLLEKLKEKHRVSYHQAAAIISLAVSVLFFDQVRLTGFAVSTALGGYDYYSFFGFLFLALGILLLLMRKDH